MRRRVCSDVIIVLMTTMIVTSSCFNIEIRNGSYGLVNLGSGLQQAPSFAALVGFSSFTWMSGNQINILAGAPKYNGAVNTKELANGTVVKCVTNVKKVGRDEHMTTDNIEFTEAVCSEAYNLSSLATGTYQQRVSDAFGMTINAIRPQEGEFTVCSPGRQKRCGDGSIFVPGACYQTNNRTTQLLEGWGEIACVETYLDVYFVIDGSSSINRGIEGSGNFDRIKSFVKNVSDIFSSTLGKTTQLGLQKYGSGSNWGKGAPLANHMRFLDLPNRTTHLGQVSSIEEFHRRVDNLGTATDGDTYTVATLYTLAQQRFNESKNFEKSKKYVILVTDGMASDAAYISSAVEEIAKNNITVFAVGVGDAKEEELLRYALNNTDHVVNIDNFLQLSDTVKTLTRSISALQSEGGTGSGKKNSLESAVFGTSGFSSTNVDYRDQSHTTRLISGIGSYDNAGGVFAQYDVTNPTSFHQLPDNYDNITSDSYLGYSSTIGKFEPSSPNKTFVVAGAPRYKLFGAVFVYDVEAGTGKISRTWKLEATSRCDDVTTCVRQVGSYLGGSVIAGDVNNDGSDDVIIGIPLYTHGKYDEGRVMVFVSNTTAGGSTSLDMWTSDTYRPQVVTGGDREGGRFGYSMAIAGDLDGDGYNDVIVSAPFAYSGEGCVYVYNGNAHGLNSRYSQEIRGSSVLPRHGGDVTGGWFGFALQGLFDVDANHYTDVVVTAPKSNSLVILRSRPVVKFSASLNFSRTTIDSFSCYRNSTQCLSATLCLSYTGKMVERQVEIDTRVELDAGRVDRIHFTPNTTATNIQVDSRDLPLDTTHCYRYHVILHPRIGDFDTEVKVRASYNLATSHSSTLMSALRNPYTTNKLEKSIKFTPICGDDLKCNYNLNLHSTPKLHSQSTHRHETEKHETHEHHELKFVVERTSQKYLHIVTSLRNELEAANKVKLLVQYLPSLTWKEAKDMGDSRKRRCTRKSHYLPDDGRYKQLEIKMTNTDYGDLFPPDETCTFELMFSLSNVLFASGRISETEVKLIATSSETATFSEANKTDNHYDVIIPIRYQSDVELIRRPSVSVMEFNYTNQLIQIRNTSMLSEEIYSRFEVTTSGFSAIPNSTLKFRYPSKLDSAGSYPLLYLIHIGCQTLEGNTACVCEDSNKDYLKIDQGFVGKGQPNPNPIEINNFDCDKNSTAFFCETIECRITNFAPNDKILFEAHFVVWAQSLNFNQNRTNTTMTSRLKFDSSDSKLVQSEHGDVIRKEAIMQTTFKQYVEKTIIEKNDNWIFMVIGSATGALLLVVILVYILYKNDFFKSRYDQLVKEHNLDGNWCEPVEENELDQAYQNQETDEYKDSVI